MVLLYFGWKVLKLIKFAQEQTEFNQVVLNRFEEIADVVNSQSDRIEALFESQMELLLTVGALSMPTDEYTEYKKRLREIIQERRTSVANEKKAKKVS